MDLSHQGQQFEPPTTGGEAGREKANEWQEKGDAMIAMAVKIISVFVAAFIGTEAAGRQLMTDAAAADIFALSAAAFVLLAVIHRVTGFGSDGGLLDDLSALLKAMMLMSMVGIFVNRKMPWLPYTPLLLLPLLLFRALAPHFKRMLSSAVSTRADSDADADAGNIPTGRSTDAGGSVSHDCFP